MTVGEVIRLLKQYPENSEVKIKDCGSPIGVYEIAPYDDGIEYDYNTPIIIGDSCGL